jgi:aminopeptidase N
MALYSKGPVLLHELAERIGRERFLDWCSELMRQEVRSTAQALEVLTALEGEEVAQWFRGLLMSR